MVGMGQAARWTGGTALGTPWVAPWEDVWHVLGLLVSSLRARCMVWCGVDDRGLSRQLSAVVWSGASIAGRPGLVCQNSVR
jgi:hypothetical protein